MVTRNDVARHAGVSVAVVSYVLNNKSIVKEETRQKVLQAMEELGYEPNHTARSLKTKKNYQLAVLTNFIGNPFEAGILLHLEEAARRYGYMVTYQSYRPDREQEIKTLLAGRVDGIILLGQSLLAETLSFFRKRSIPIVSVMKPVLDAEEPVVSVDVDWVPAYRQVIRTLYGLGHRHIAYMSHGDRRSPLERRKEQFIRAMEAEGNLLYLQACTHLEGQGKYESAYQTMMSLSPPDYSAVVCANDLMAIGTNAACRARKWAVPERLSIVGSENILMVSETHPPIAALEYPRSLAAGMAVEKLMRMMAGEADASKELDAPFVERQSLQVISVKH
jgi:DNA-binding LacI/PurR family transcriptional regulator